VTLAESKWSEARSARGIVRPKLHKRSEMKFIGRTILRCQDNPANVVDRGVEFETPKFKG
jgi:hypothetical protein